MKNGVIFNKLNKMDEVLGELKSIGTIDSLQLEKDWRTKRAIERDLQVLCEIVIDICQRVISLSDQSPATTGREAVQRCVNLGALSSIDPYEKMVQFRNFIVHRYEQVDDYILIDIMNNRLNSFELFRKEIKKYASS